MGVCIDLSGQKFGRLTVLSRAGIQKTHALWECQCECGNKSIATTSNLKKGSTTSCGCYDKERRIKHGNAKAELYVREYQIWKGMNKRCHNPTTEAFKYYGGRGISICKRWEKYESFISDMGACPPGLTLERKNVNGNYEPDNCKWATRQEQTDNRRCSPKNRILKGAGHNVKMD